MPNLKSRPFPLRSVLLSHPDFSGRTMDMNFTDDGDVLKTYCMRGTGVSTTARNASPCRRRTKMRRMSCVNGNTFINEENLQTSCRELPQDSKTIQQYRRARSLEDAEAEQGEPQARFPTVCCRFQIQSRRSTTSKMRTRRRECTRTTTNTSMRHKVTSTTSRTRSQAPHRNRSVTWCDHRFIMKEPYTNKR